MLGVACNTDQKVKVTAQPTTSGGHPARFDGALRVTVQSGDGTAAQDPAEPNSFFAVSGDGPGDTVYLVEGDADLGAGTTLIQDTVTLTVEGANAASFGLVAGIAEPK
jgi:hypothetical protein